MTQPVEPRLPLSRPFKTPMGLNSGGNPAQI
jgi:hypothetical protein